MADYGLKVSKAGYDVKTTGIGNQIFNSEKNCIKIAMSGDSSHDVTDGSTYTFTIDHPFSFAPCFLAYYEWANNGKWAMATDNIYILNQFEVATDEAWSDTYSLYVKVSNDSGATRTCKIFYIVFADRGS